MKEFPILKLFLGIVGGIVGGAIGLYACKWLHGQGYYAIVLPGALVGLGFGYAARHCSVAFGIVSALIGFIAGLATEWTVIYGGKPSLTEFLQNLKSDSPVTWILLGVGVALAYSFGVGRKHRRARPFAEKNAD